MISVVRVAIAGGVFGGWSLLTRNPPLTRAQWRLVTAQAASFVAMSYCYYEAIRTTNIAVAVMLQYTAPVWIALYECATAQRRWSRKIVIVLGLSLVGCLLLVRGYHVDVWRVGKFGLAIGLVSAWAFGAYSVLGRRGHALGIASHRMLAHTFLISLGFWMVVLLIAASLGRPLMPAWRDLPWGYGIFIGLAGTTAPTWCQLQGLKTVSAFSTMLIGMTEPIAATLFAWMLLGEQLTAPQLLGMLLIAVAVVWSQWKWDCDITASAPAATIDRPRVF